VSIFKNKKMKAYGLVEILISMAIFAVAIISITSLNAKNFKQIKANEISDLSNKLMVSTLEYMKSPSTGGVVESIQDKMEAALLNDLDGVVCFYIAGDIMNIWAAEIYANFQIEPTTLNCDVNAASLTTSNYRLQPNSCTSSSVYLIGTTDTVLQGLKICNQIIVKRDAISRGYLLISRVAYEKGVYDSTTNSSFGVNEIFGFRPYTYEEE
jgi:hypothetical protein